MNDRLLAVEDLHVQFRTYAGLVHAVNGMTFTVRPGEIFGLVGESGCGKSVTGFAVLRMIPYPGEVVRGCITFQGTDLLQKDEAEMQQVRGGRIAMIFQDPSASLNPVFTVGNQVTRVIRQHTSLKEAEARARALETFAAVGLPDPTRVYRSYPHELSGGMKQRVMISLALSCGAELLIADEPTTALDVTIQAQILALLVALQVDQGVSILLITHDLSVVAETCHRVGVAYAGDIVEMGQVDEVLYNTKHPYTEGLLGALPRPTYRGQALRSISGSVPDGIHVPPGCPFHPRCPVAMEICHREKPHLMPYLAEAAHSDDVGAHSHVTACYLYQQDTGQSTATEVPR